MGSVAGISRMTVVHTAQLTFPIVIVHYGTKPTLPLVLTCMHGILVGTCDCENTTLITWPRSPIDIVKVSD